MCGFTNKHKFIDLFNFNVSLLLFNVYCIGLLHKIIENIAAIKILYLTI